MRKKTQRDLLIVGAAIVVFYVAYQYYKKSDAELNAAQQRAAQQDSWYNRFVNFVYNS